MKARIRFYALPRMACKRILVFRRESNLPQCLIEVRNQIFDILDPDGNANESVSDADALADFGWDGGMRHRCRVRDQRFDSAEALGERAQCYMVQHFSRIFEGNHVE